MQLRQHILSTRLTCLPGNNPSFCNCLNNTFLHLTINMIFEFLGPGPADLVDLGGVHDAGDYIDGLLLDEEWHFDVLAT